jgi:hypothetical protein
MGFLDKLNQGLEEAEKSGVDSQIIQEESNKQINPEQEVDFGANMGIDDEQGQMDQVNEAVGQQMSSGFDQPDLESGTFVDARMIDAGINEQFGNSLSRGVGTVLGGFGDLFQAVPGILTFGASDKAWQENTLSEFFHEAANNIQMENQNFIPEEFKEISMSTLGSLEGWKYLISNQVAETLPYMAEFILTGMGAGAVVKKGATALAKKQIQKYGIKKAVAEGAIKKVGRDGSERILKNSKNFKSGTVRDRLRRELLSENGLSKTGQGVANTIGAGAANNQLIAITQSAEAVNHAKSLRDDEGNPLFNEDELAQIGVDTWQTESAYILADIASWGFTFGKVPKGTLNGIGIKSGASLTKTTGARVAKVLAKAGIEGGEETVQEVFEEWAKNSSIDKAKLKKGLITEEEYLNSETSKGFFDYYTSKETEGLRIVAGLMGGLMAGVKTSVDLMGEKSALLRNKEELVKAQIKGNNQGELKAAQLKARQMQIAEDVFDENHDSLEQTFRSWVDSGSATEEEYDEFVKNANDYVKVFNQSQNLNIDGVERLYSLLASRKEAEILFDKASKERSKSIADFKEMKLGKDPDSRFEQGIAAVEIEEKAKLKENLQRINKEVENHILGKKAEGVIDKNGEIQKDEKGNTLVRGFSDKDYKNYTVTGEEAAKEESVVESTVSKATDFLKNIFKSKKKKESEVETPEEAEAKNSKDDSSEEAKGEVKEEVKEESKPTYTEDEFVESLVTDDEKFDYIINQVGLNPDDEKAPFTAYKKVFGEKLTMEKASAIKKYMNSPSGDNVSERENKLRSNFTAPSKPKVETPEQAEAKNSKDDSSSGKLTKEQEEDKEFLEGDSKPTKKSEPKGRFRKELGEESDNRKTVKEEADKEKLTVKAYLSKQVQKLKEKAKSIRESKEVEGLLEEINSIEEFNEFKNTKFYKELIALKSDKIIQQTRNKLVESLKIITSPAARRSVLNKIKAIDTAGKVKSVESNLSYVTEKVTKKTRANLYTIEEIHSLNGLSADPGVNAKLSIIKQNLKKTHPEVDVVMVDDLSNILGGKKMAYVIGSTIFINAESVNQPDVIAHELSHVYYALTKNTEATKRLVKNLARNTKRVDSLKDGYWEEVVYSFKAKNGKIIKRSASQLETEFDSLKQFLDSMDAAGYSNATELPIEEQEVILDELFAYNVESKISGKYDAYFESDEKKRRLNFYEKGFFQNVKSKLSLGFVKNVEAQKTIDYLKDLDLDGIPTKTEHLQEFITKEFKKGFPAKNIHSAVRGRNRFDIDLDNQVNKSLQDNKNIDPFETTELIQTEDEAQKEIKQIFADLFRNVSEGNTAFEDSYQEDLIDEVSGEEDVETSTLDDKIDVYTKSITNQLNSFVDIFNKKRYKDNRKDEIISRGEVMVPLMILAAQNFDSNLEFIKALEESDNEILNQYLRWLKIKSKGQYENRLVSVHTVLSNVLIMDSFVTEEGKDGINVNNGLSTQEQNDADTAIDYLQQGYKYDRNEAKESLTDAQKVIGKNFNEFRKILVKINKNIALKNAELDLAFNTIFRNSGIDAGVVDVKIDSNFYTLRTALVNELKKASKVDVKRYANGNVEFGNLDRYKLRPLINGVIAANRRYTSGMMAQNSDGNNVSMMQKSMFFINETKRIARDIANPKMTIGKFSKKYGKNPLAIAMFKGKKTIQFAQNLGITTFNGNSVYKDSKSDPLFTNDFVMFLKGGPNSYMQPMTVSGESARRYYSSLPKIKSSNMAKTMQDAAVLAVSDGDIRFETKSGKASGVLLQKEIDKEIERITEEIESNADLYKRLQKKIGKTLLRNDGKVSLEGKISISDYATNHTLNQIYLKNLYDSGVSESELSKRGKSKLAPITPINSSGNMKLGIINVSDLEINSDTLKNSGLTDEEINTTDSMNFVLPIDLSRVQSIYGTGMRVGNILKLFSHAKERENTNALNKNVTIKGLTFVLTDEFVNENPGYKPLRDALQSQRDYYIEMHNNGKPLPFNLNNGQSNFLPMAVASSALKTGGIKEKSISIDELKNTETALAKINELNEFNGGLGYGFNGADIGIQNLMDKPYEKSVLGSQVQTNFFINAANLGNLKRVEDMQQKIFNISERKLKNEVIRHLPKDVNNITDKDLQKLTDLVQSSTNKDLVDPLTLNLLDNFSISLPYLQGKVSQILKNKIVKSGLRMYTDGTVGLQMADFGMYKADGEGKFDSDLKSYGTGDNSTFWSDSRGKLNKSTTPAESLVSDAFAEKANTRLRSTKDYSETEATVIAKKIAIEQAQNLGLTGKKRVDYENKHTQLLIGENQDGSWFVRGEFFLATRIPSHGLQTTLVLEAKGTTKGMGSAIVVPSELSTIMGSDFDGDALYMNMSNSNKKGDVYQMQESLKDDMIDYMTNEDVQSDLFVTLNIKKLGAEVETMIESITGEKIGLTDKVLTKEEEKELLLAKPYVSTPTGQKEAFKDNVETRSLVGLAASLHRFLNVLSAYETKFKTKINIDGVSKTEFKDEGDNNTRSTKTALLLNVILDNANNKIAEKVGINPATASQYILLSGMGYEAPVISAIMLSDAGKAWTKASNNRNNPFYKTTGKDYVIDEAKKISGVESKLNKDVINIDTKTLNSAAGKASVLQLLNDLDKMQSEAFKINKILSTHKSIETNPFLLENQLNEFNEFINGSGLIEYSPEFRKSAFVQKYVKGVELAIDVNKKTDVAYSATGRNIMKSIKSIFEKEITKKDYGLIKSKVVKALYMDAFKDSFNFKTSEIIEKLYGEDNVFDRLNKYFIEKDMSGETSIIQKHLNVKNEISSKRISLNSGLQQFGNEDIFNDLREEFKSLPDNLANDLIIYDFVVNGLNGTGSIFPIFDTTTIQLLETSFNELLSKNAKSKNNSTTAAQKKEIYRSLHDLALELPNEISKETGKTVMSEIKPGSEMYNNVVLNKPFIRYFTKGDKKYLYEFIPLSDAKVSEIRTKNGDTAGTDTNLDFSSSTKNDMVALTDFSRLGNPIVLSQLKTPKSEIFNDINILNFKSEEPTNTPKPNIKPVNINSKKKSLGRNRLDGSEGITNRMNRDQWNARNDLSGSSTETNNDYKKYLDEYDTAQEYHRKYLAKDQAEGLTDSEIDSLIERFSKDQPEAVSIINNTLGNEKARRLSMRGTDVTGVYEGKDLSRGEKWFISSNIPSRLPAMQALARKVSERFKDFLRSRNESYDLINKATKDLYKSKFDNRFVKFNPFKGKDHYRQLYGNLIVEEKVGEKGVNNIRLKDKSVIDELFRVGKISKEEKAFYDVFTSITSKYKGLLDDKKDRRGYVPHTKQSVLESYSNRGMLGAFMNFQTTEDKVRDVILKGYDPIANGIVSQTFKKFEDSYNAASSNKEFGNQNKWKTKDLALLKFKAQRLQKKGLNEDGTEIKMSSYSIETLANSGSRNRFTNQRSNKATLYPSMDLNKAIMDYTHASAFATSFRDMLPEIQGLISYYKQKGNDNAVKVLETYYRDKIIRGKNPETLLGSKGDKGLKILNTVVVFSLLGFQTAFAAGNVIAGKYHNIKNGKKGGKEWAKGEKRFWGFDGAEGGIKGWAANFKSSMEFLKKIGFMEQNIYEDINLEKQWNPITKLETLALLPMTLSEKWIQGVQFLGMLSDEEWSAWKNEGKMISIEKQTQYEDDVKKSQGRGYNFTDQRMISLYSLGQSFMMFNKFIPTMITDRFNQEEVDAYGRKNIGSLRQFGDTAKDVISGRMRYSEFKEYRSKLEPHKQVALDKAVRGMALVVLAGVAGAAAGGVGDDDTKYLMDGLVMDANYAINVPKLARKLSNIPTLGVTRDLLNPN